MLFAQASGIILIAIALCALGCGAFAKVYEWTLEDMGVFWPSTVFAGSLVLLFVWWMSTIFGAFALIQGLGVVRLS